MVDRFHRNFLTRTDKEEGPGHPLLKILKIGHENPMDSSAALSHIVPEDERMVQKDRAAFSSAVHGVTRSWNLLNGTKKKKIPSIYLFLKKKSFIY